MKKNLLLIGFVAILMFVGLNTATAQKTYKLGHLNSQELLEKMPALDTVNAKLQKIQADNEKQLEVMAKEYEQKMKELQGMDPNNTPQSVQDLKTQELLDLQNRVRKFQQQAQQDLEKKRVELVQPILDKVEKAIDDVAAENNYDYIFDTSYGTVLHYPQGEDISALVKKKLGLK